MVASASFSDITPRPSYAALGRRVAAYLIDFVLFFAVWVLVAITLLLIRHTGFWTPTGGGRDPHNTWAALSVGSKLLVVLAYVVASGPSYFILFHASSWQATFGKRLLRIHVTDGARRQISVAYAAKRWFAMFLFNWFGGSIISLVTISASEQHQALHDMAANTLVLNGKVEAPPVELWRVFLAFGIPWVWMVVTFLITL
jgi:uncharacterized RDD family membrane protein YckC